MQCVFIVSYFFLINSSTQGTLTLQCGICQGNPLSPYIFILCNEVLSDICKKAQVESSLSGIRIVRRSPLVNHLLFVDDIILFCKSNTRSCEGLLSILRRYELASGQYINCQQSAITFSSKNTLEVREKTKRLLGIPKEIGLGKYMGLIEHFGRRKKTYLLCGPYQTKANIICYGELKTTTHLFFHCYFPKQLWRTAPLARNLDSAMIPDFRTGLCS